MAQRYSSESARNRKLWLVLPVAALIVTLLAVGIIFFPDQFQPLRSGAKRAGNSFSFLFLGEPPHFYSLDM
jgi:hypothetical protein